MPKNYPKCIELYRTDAYYIFHYGEHSLWWNRTDGSCQAKSGWDLASAVNPECLGVLYGIVGKIEVPNLLTSRLMLIRQYEYVGDLPNNTQVFKIKSVSFLPLIGPDVTNQELGLDTCSKHHNKKSSDKLLSGASGMFDLHKQQAFAKTWGTIKSATNTIKTTTQQAAAIASSQVKIGKKRDVKENDKIEKRILEELHKLVIETDSFYFSPNGDLTNSLQRQWKISHQRKQQNLLPLPIWKQADDRFFWNKDMLKDIINLETEIADPWLMPIIQGFVQIAPCKVNIGLDHRREAMEPCYQTFTISLISRRSRYRAGTRYKRRGVDDSGKCANYVETEQIISYHQHQISYVQVRGSVPVYWSQPGYKYRPPPRLDKDENETQIAFENHFHEELSIYGPICVISLVDQSGKEKIINDAYTNHVYNYNCPDLTYVTFDFHEYCRGMHFENVSVLLSNIYEIIQESRFCWLDREGMICMQNGVNRVNCIDCLDRTNVVQTAIAKAVMEIVFTKLGLISPEGILPANIRNTFQLLWANNGDTISRQYAGTNALKGDYTRTGERKFTGLMKDGMNSASRYYLSRFKDTYRQAVIDVMLGNPIEDEVFSVEKGAQDTEDLQATAEHVKLLMEDCKKLLVPHTDVVLGAWGLIDADPVTGDPSETDMDVILILTPTCYYMACYDDQTDRITNYQRVLLQDLTSIELGLDPSGVNLFKKSTNGHYCIRLNYKFNREMGYFHMFRSTNLRFFNNMAIVIRNEEEIVESMKAVCEAFSVAIEVQQLTIPVHQGMKLEKRKSKVLPNTDEHRSLLDMPHITRNLSENQLLALKNVGTKAISNVTQQLNKLGLGSGMNQKKYPSDNESVSQEKPVFSIGPVTDEAGDRKSCSIQDFQDLSQTNIRADSILPSCGILAGEITTDESDNSNTSRLYPPLHGMTCSQSDINLNASPSPNRSITPEITVDAAPSNTLSTCPDARQLSHSSSEVDKKPPMVKKLDLLGRGTDNTRSTSEKDLSMNMSSSQSESALKSLRGGFTSVLTSPISTKEIVLTPLSRLAKGVQNLGANLDPRKLKPTRIPNAESTEEYRKLQEKWKNCKTRLIAL